MVEPAPVATAITAAPASTRRRVGASWVMNRASTALGAHLIGPLGERAEWWPALPGHHNGRVSDTFFDQFGGAPAFALLVSRFYEGVSQDELLRPMYPEQDLEPAAERLRWFLEQYWGGPTTYSQERGHPRLRMRHAPYVITPDARDIWLTHMRAAVDELRLEPELDEELWDYLVSAAYSMVNTPGPDAGRFA